VAGQQTASRRSFRRACVLRSVLMPFLIVCFFFSSRRRHTRFSRDWSSDVCSSDLDVHPERAFPVVHVAGTNGKGSTSALVCAMRSEERRVGKECRSRGSRDHEKKKKCGGTGHLARVGRPHGNRSVGEPTSKRPMY